MRLSTDYVPLARDDLAAGVPLGFDLFDADGAALLPAGTTLHDAAQHAFLFDHFRPVRRRDDAEAAAEPRAPAAVPHAQRMGLSPGASIGIRRRVGTTRGLQRCRLIGIAASGALFVEPQPAAALDFARGDDIEAVAIGRAAVSRFGATVESVQEAGAARFLVLSSPGFVDRLRTRAEPRVPVRIAACCAGGSEGAEGIGMVHDISVSGLSIAVDRPIAAIGETLRVQLPYAAGDRVELLALDGTVRAVHADPAAPALTLHHAAFGETGADDLIRLKALLFDRLMASPDTGRRR
ncbi:PilZ domain-containing protein [Burkholderia contaminans]|uniref:PilZ domain-containing protein n=1 Tax=Burkholderia contaminans TaxID=488447 RepID=A0AAP4R1H3_9BURK|nr:MULTISPECIES: PilZ domain-containing protein [Burkholderia]MBD1410170.1 PilZ domain-containing protein [Burkholderia contaminans]MBH9666340.1 PilZ domain-containing protein [Burkholderia contaminans]MBH9674110.1 PilZ domain-containing protein [Burkholderia contaminans]MBH9704156.1 PilZ domain-containing protein [Burkholderia contaminans]MBH9719385.1 PilZ domain-containing protein [Burkholderia contaminans]